MTIAFDFVAGSNGKKSLTVVVKGNVYPINSDHPRFKEICKSLNMNEDFVLSLIRNEKLVRSEVATPVSSNIEVKGGVIYHRGERVEQYLIDEFGKLEANEIPVEGFLKYVTRLYENVSNRVRTQLFNFMKRYGLTIDSEGNMIGYKAITKDWKDLWTRKLDYRIGNTVSMDRGKVNDDPDQGCAPGLHVGSEQYAYGYHNSRREDRIVLVKVDPANVVCIPKCTSYQKLRTCEFTILGAYQGKLTQTVYSSDLSGDELYKKDSEVDQGLDIDWTEYEDSADICADDRVMDDMISAEDVTITTQDKDAGEFIANAEKEEFYAIKPEHSVQAGRKYWNNRDSSGRFVRQR